jgi:signal transduction histidine kinase
VRLPIERTRFDVAELLTEVAAGARAGASLAVTKIEVDARDVGELFTDRRRLALVLRQLIDNAIDNTRDGSIELRARRRKGGEMAIEVRDTGMGMSPRQLERHFEGPIALALHDGDRIGLGVPLARKLVELLGGTLTAVSTPGEGTTVTVRFTGSSAVE